MPRVGFHSVSLNSSFTSSYIFVVIAATLSQVYFSCTVFIAFLLNYKEENWEKLWNDYRAISSLSLPSFKQTSTADFAKLIFSLAKTGSNSVAIGKEKSSTGGAILANDPHLEVTIPNVWLIAGYRSPSYHAVGLMIPCLPFLALGRNKNIAWGGTNLWSVSTHFFKLTEEDLENTEVKTEKIKVRGWFSTSITIRTSKNGPVLSDSPLFKDLPPTAIRWMGHEVSDEISAFLRANRADSFSEFRNAFESYSVSGQNLLYADKLGNIGHILAYRQPIRPDEKNDRLFQPATNAWLGFRHSCSLPFTFNPEEHFIVSANNKPSATEAEIGWFYQSSDRFKRLTELIKSTEKVSVKDLMSFQQDTYSLSGIKIKQNIIEKLKKYSPPKEFADFWQSFTSWDGYYHKESQGCVAFEVLMYHFVKIVFDENYKSDNLTELAMSNVGWKSLIFQFLEECKPSALETMISLTLSKGNNSFKKYANWGDMHTMKISHVMEQIPVIGKRYYFGEYPISGGSDTVMKAVHKFSQNKTSVNYGANARQISDLSNIDENYFLIFGGQDGWLTSPQTFDQIPLWQKGETIRLPLSKEGVAEVFTTRIELDCH
ncbi:MAG: penicillin acylase family protein [Silvanigrellaceae bacterium]|nr:penicillin acylase family protein [Silvanigrellaceae bacterium]